MAKIGDILANKQTPEKQKGGITSNRAYIVRKLISFMGEDYLSPEELEKPNREKRKQKKIAQRMGYWLGRTKHLTAQQIFDLMTEAKDGNNPPALFNYLLKEHGKKETS